MASPARIEDQLLAAMQQVVPNQRITPAAVRQLQRFVSDNALALACLCWMRKVSRSYTNSALLIGAAEFQCLPPGGWQESAFLRANPQSRQKG